MNAVTRRLGSYMGALPKIWEITDRFKGRCRSKGWETLEHEDLVNSGGKYHSFLWIRTIYPSTFKGIVKGNKHAIREGSFYRMVNVTYTAWVCDKPSLEPLKQTIAENPDLLKRNAIYDLSQAYINGVYEKINETASEVFREFERFLEEELGLKLQPVQTSIPKALT